jgi:hypothetical protein
MKGDCLVVCLDGYLKAVDNTALSVKNGPAAFDLAGGVLGVAIGACDPLLRDPRGLSIGA